jgi:hypothetical protein
LWLYLRFTLSYRNVKDLLAEGSVEKLGVPAVRGSRPAAPASTANSVPASASCFRPSIPPQS